MAPRAILLKTASVFNLREAIIGTTVQSRVFNNINHHYSSSSRNLSVERPFRRNRRQTKYKIKPSLNKFLFNKAVSRLSPRFDPEELCNVLNCEGDPLVCLELFNWATRQPRFKHHVSTYHIIIRKLGFAKMYKQMDDIAYQVVAVRGIQSEAIFNCMIYFFSQARRLSRAVTIFRHMRSIDCKPSLRTYNLLFAAFVSRGYNTYVNYMYMETVRCLFKRMIDDGIEPDIFCLNSMIKGYVISLHVNDALRIFHQMGVVYKILPNSFSYDYLIHGLCVQGRTNNAMELFEQMKRNSFLPSNKSYNSLVNALAIGGEIEKAEHFLCEMYTNGIKVDLITYRTILDEICRKGRVQEAFWMLKAWQEKKLVCEDTYRKLLYVLEEDDYGDSSAESRYI